MTLEEVQALTAARPTHVPRLEDDGVQIKCHVEETAKIMVHNSSPKPSRTKVKSFPRIALLQTLSLLWLTAQTLGASCVVLADAPPSDSIPHSTHNGHYQRLREAAAADLAREIKKSDTHAKIGSSPSLPTISNANTRKSLLPALLRERPPWNPSPHIDDTGFVNGAFRRVPGEWESEMELGGPHQNPLHLELVQAHIRQVPGDGNCLFHSISTCMAYTSNNQTQLEYPHHLGWLYRHSAHLRQQAVDCLKQHRRILFLQGHDYLRAHDLVEAAASQYGISAEEYCELMQRDSYWGGGPEIVALCNVLKRPIHVYELAAAPNDHHHSTHNSHGVIGSASDDHQNDQESGRNIHSHHRHVFVLRRMACFGSPKYDKKEPFHILSADSRFPDIAPGKQLPSGNHFLAVFPLERQQARLQRWIKEEQKRQRMVRKEHRRKIKQQRRQKPKKKGTVRGGGDGDIMATRKPDTDDDDEELLFPRDENGILDPVQRMVLERARMRRRQERAAARAAASRSPVKSYLKGLWNSLFVKASVDDGTITDDHEDN